MDYLMEGVDFWPLEPQVLTCSHGKDQEAQFPP